MESNTELRNLISEEDDVQKAYENIVKQKDEVSERLLDHAELLHRQ